MRAPEIIETERLVLRPPRPPDAHVIFDLYARDAEVTRYLVWKPHADPGMTEAFIAACIERRENGTGFPWVIERRAGGQLLGMLDLRPDGFKMDMGYVLARPFWGKGYASEAARAVVDWAIAQAGIYRVWATCDVENLASARVLEKAGMQREGLLRRWIRHANLGEEPRDSWCYARVR